MSSLSDLRLAHKDAGSNGWGDSLSKRDWNQCKSLTIVVMLLLGTCLSIFLSGSGVPLANACAPSPAAPQSNSTPNCCSPSPGSITDQVVETVQQWTPVTIANSPYLGQVQAFQGITQADDFFIGITPLGGAYDSSSSTGAIINDANGRASGYFELATWETHDWQQQNCVGSNGGSYSKVTNWGIQQKFYDYAPAGTTSDANLPTQFSVDGYQSIQFDMRFEPSSHTVNTLDTTCSAPGQQIVASGSSSNSFPSFFVDISVTIGAATLDVGQFRLSYTSGSQYEYTYTFNQGEWQWHYLGGGNYLRAFSYVGSGSCSDFGLSANPASLSIFQAGSGTSSITLSSLNGFTGPVTLSAAQSPPNNNLYVCLHGQPCTSNGDSLIVNLTPGGTASVPLTVSISCNSAPPGTYYVTLTGTASTPSISHSTTVQVTVNGPFCDFGLAANPSSLRVNQGGVNSTTISLTSINGFSGNVTLNASSQSGSGINPTFGALPGVTSTTISLTGGGSVSTTLKIYPGCVSTTPGTYTVTVTGSSSNPTVTHSTSISVTVTSASCGGGGSVAAGTLITLSNGTQVPVQNLHAGMQLLSYDMTTHQYAITDIYNFTTVQVNNLMTIQTASGPALIVDQNPAQKLWVQLPNGTITLMSVTNLHPGYELFQAITQTWTPITTIDYVNHGHYIMYDIYTTAPGNYIANGYLDPNK